jgi:hypothetical protein
MSDSSSPDDDEQQDFDTCQNRIPQGSPDILQPLFDIEQFREILERATSFYMLDENHRPIPVEKAKIDEWEAWHRNLNNRIVGRTTINQYTVSTVFLSIDHGFGEKPMWFETMVIVKDDSEKGEHFADYQKRYETWEEAVQGHEDLCRIIREGNF